MDKIIQIWIVVFGCSAIWFIGRLEDWSSYGHILGLIGQPAWFYIAIKNKQWGMLLVVFCYTFAWIQGIWLNFF